MSSSPDDASSHRIPTLFLAARFLLPADERKHAEDDNWRAAGHWLVFWGVLIGVAYAGVFRGAWRWFGEYEYIRWMPAAVVLAADMGLLGYRLFAGAAAVADRRYIPGPGGLTSVGLPAVTAVVLIAIVKFALIVSLPEGRFQTQIEPGWGRATWGPWLGRLYPEAIYRPLILMPVWGRWAMSLALCLGRPAPGASPRLQQMTSGARLSVVMLFWLLSAALTTWYCSGSSSDLLRGVTISLGVLTAAYCASFLAARRAGGQTEATVALTGLVAEVGFLVIYHPTASSIYWY